jgi:hypothetical protein
MDVAIREEKKKRERERGGEGDRRGAQEFPKVSSDANGSRPSEVTNTNRTNDTLFFFG